MEIYDVVIIGSGLGGLECAYILSKEGYKVCVLEKNRQLGGSLQIFVRDKAIFDTGVHYVGGLDDGQNLNQCFKYFNIMDKLNLHRLDEDGFDKVSFEDDPTDYYHAQGHQNFIEQLTEKFPQERRALTSYIQKMHDVCNYFPMYELRKEETPMLGLKYMDINVKDYIASLTSNVKLQNVLAGTNPLYAGLSDKAPLYVHALIMNSYIESSYKFVDGGAQIEKRLTKNLLAQGCIIRNYAEVSGIVEENGKVQYVELKDGERIYGKDYISNIHPALTLDMLKSTKVKKAFRNRISKLENCSSAFVIDVVLKPNTFKYMNHNSYHYSRNDVWGGVNGTQKNWPDSFCMFVPKTSKPGEYANSVTILTYMKMEDVEEWKNTYSIIPHSIEDRGDSYQQFKMKRAEMVFKLVFKKYPGLKNCIKSYTTGTPLTYRDYIGNKDGSLYGIAKDYKDPLRTLISPNTKIPNLYFTGQNLNMHGVLGVTIGSIRTCSEFIGKDYLLDKINKA